MTDRGRRDDPGGGNAGLACREALVLNGHGASPVLAATFDGDGGTDRLARSCGNGALILLDVIAKTGLFHLLGDRGFVTGLVFLWPPGGAEGLTKVWDLGGQFCVRTIAGHRGNVADLACARVRPLRPGDCGDRGRWQLVTGCANERVRMWSSAEDTQVDAHGTAGDDKRRNAGNGDTAFWYMGTQQPPRHPQHDLFQRGGGVCALPSEWSVYWCRLRQR